MLNKNVVIDFSHNYGLNQFQIRANYIIYGFELNGDVYEDVDFELIEDYQGDKIRLLVKVIFERLSKAQTLLLIRYIISTSKKMSIDGFEFEVVNDFDSGEFGLLDDLNEYATIELGFKARSVGVDDFLEAITETESIVLINTILVPT